MNVRISNWGLILVISDNTVHQFKVTSWNSQEDLSVLGSDAGVLVLLAGFLGPLASICSLNSREIIQ